MGKVLRRLFGEKKVNPHTTSPAGRALGSVLIRFGDTGKAQAGQRLDVRSKSAVRTDHQDLPHLVKVAGADLNDARIIGARSAVRPHHQLELGRAVSLRQGRTHRVELGLNVLLETLERSLAWPAGNQSRRTGGAHDLFRSQIVSVAVASAFARQDAHPASRRDPLRRRLDDRFIHGERSRGQVLEVKVCVITACGQRFPKIALQVVGSNAKLLKEKALILRHFGSWFWMIQSKKKRTLYSPIFSVLCGTSGCF